MRKSKYNEPGEGLFVAPEKEPKTGGITRGEFLAFMQKTIEDVNGCWLYISRVNIDGYARMRWRGRQMQAHRFAYIALRANIPEGMILDHLCRVRNCVNPQHLEVVTPRENTLRGETEARRNASKTHCHRGHPLEGENLQIDNRGKRQCRICGRIRERQQYVAKNPNALKRGEWHTHCRKGHEMNEQNTRIDKTGHQRCRKCHADNAIRAYRIKKGVVTALLCTSIMLYGTNVLGQFAVVDAGNIAQNIIQATNSVRQVAQQAQSLINQATQIYNQVQQIQHLYTQVQHGVTNLQRLDLNYARDLLNLAGQIDQKLGQAQYLGYQVSTVVTQMNALYDGASKVLTGDEQNILRTNWARANREAANVAANVQAIQRQLQAQGRRVSEITQKISVSQGNLDTLQALGQAQGLANTQLLSIEQQLAAQGRLQALALQEQAAREQAALAWERQWLPPGGDDSYRGQGRVLRLTQ